MRAARTRRAWAALVLAGGLTLAGCSAGGDGDKASSEAAQAGTKTDGDRAAPDDGAGAGDTAREPDTGEQADRETGTRKAAPPASTPGTGGANASGTSKPLPAAAVHVIRTAELRIEVADVAKAVAEARRITAAQGGYVGEESSGFAREPDPTRTTGDGDIASGGSVLTIRVPQERYEATLTALARGGKVLSRKTDAKDVTDQVVDVESRIASQRASVARVRELMDRAEKLSDIVTLESELGRRQADLESLLAQRSSLRNRSAMSTITLDYRAPKERPAEPKDDDGPGVGDAVEGGWDALVSTVRWTAVVIGAVLPFLLPLGLGAAIWWALRRRALRRGAVPRRSATYWAAGPDRDGGGGDGSAGVDGGTESRAAAGPAGGRAGDQAGPKGAATGPDQEVPGDPGTTARP
ncbi:DUF4349 domain-containing protein [Streptomyces sp. NPDC020875]|uniref:DUF4349 domain-containing protein n=1 Tax=Streptomyces sp. NPDC020875 TaxID=3154898 RepID=UPI0034017986